MTDWSGFGPGIIETFIGVLFALIFQKIYEDLKETKEANEQKVKIGKELTQILGDLARIHESNIMVLNPIKMPIYQGLVNSTKISLLDRFIWYDELLSIYSDLSTYNAWCEFRLTNCTDDKVQEVDDIIKDIEDVFLGKKPEDDPNACLYNVCPVCSSCKSEKVKLKGSMNCLLAKVSITDKSDYSKKSFTLTYQKASKKRE